MAIHWTQNGRTQLHTGQQERQTWTIQNWPHTYPEKPWELYTGTAVTYSHYVNRFPSLEAAKAAAELGLVAASRIGKEGN